MQHGVTVGTDWDEILFRIDRPLTFGQGRPVVDVYELSAEFKPVNGLEVETADLTCVTVDKAGSACCRVSFISICRDLLADAFPVNGWCAVPKDNLEKPVASSITTSASWLVE